MAGGPEAAGASAAVIRDLLGEDAVLEPAIRRTHAVGGVVPEIVARPADAGALSACVAGVAAAGGALVALGRGAHRALGHPPRRYDLALSTTRLARVVDYVPADMTVTVEAGLGLAALQDTLATEGQWLPLDPPLPDETTVGGLIAADLGGALQGSQGRVRDLLIGIAVVMADGRGARAGGRVVKNVAGYDLMKLFTGSLGTLAVVTEATFKVRPHPPQTWCVALACSTHTTALTLADRLAASRLTVFAATLGWALPARPAAAPAAAPGLDDGRPLLVCVLGGIDAEIAGERERLLALVRGSSVEVVCDGDGAQPAAHALIAARRDFVRRAAGTLVVRAVTLPRRACTLAAALNEASADMPGGCVLDPHLGAITAALAPPDPGAALERVRELARIHGARLVVERWPAALAASVEVWWPAPAALPLMRRVKATLDPAGVLAPGRFVGRI